MTGLSVSTVSASSPDMSDEQFAEFVEDIRKNGQLVPIWVRGGEVIDGRKRLAACERLGVTPKVIDVSPEQDGPALSRSLNALRTHYTKGQLAMYAAERANATKGSGPAIRDKIICKNTDDRIITVAEAAREVGVSESLVNKARAMRIQSPHLVDAVKAGKIRIPTHAPKMPEPRRREPVRSQAGMRVQSAPPLEHQWNELLNQAEFAADNLEASADRAALHARALPWLERLRGVRATMSKVIHIMEDK